MSNLSLCGDCLEPLAAGLEKLVAAWDLHPGSRRFAAEDPLWLTMFHELPGTAVEWLFKDCHLEKALVALDVELPGVRVRAEVCDALTELHRVIFDCLCVVNGDPAGTVETRGVRFPIDMLLGLGRQSPENSVLRAEAEKVLDAWGGVRNQFHHAARYLRQLILQIKIRKRQTSAAVTTEPPPPVVPPLIPPNCLPDDLEDLERMPRRLLEYMNGKIKASLEELCPAVWGADADQVGENALKAALQKANLFLKANGGQLLTKVRNQPLIKRT